MEELIQVFSVIFYISLIVLVIALIILVVNANKTIQKVDKLIDDVNTKSEQLNGLFHIVDTTTGAMMSISDNIVKFIAEKVEKIFNRKKEKDNE